MRNHRLFLVFLSLIVAVGFFLRIYNLSGIPSSLNPDEASLGYNAYSILKTGTDEHGKIFPLSLESFGDWKLPVYSYVDTSFVALFNLSEFSVRLPSVLAGTVGIILIYLISLRLFKKKEIGLFSALFFALSPWSIYFSRAAYEVNLATTFFLGGLLLFLIALSSTSKKIFYLLSAILFGLTLFTYHSFIIFVPLFLIFLVLSKFRRSNWNIGNSIFIFIVFLFILVSLFSNLFGSATKFNTTTIFNNKDILYGRVDSIRGDGAIENPIIQKIHTKYLGIPYQIAQNYINSFSPAFLFDKGGEKLIHNLNGFGNLYLFDALLLFAGFAGLFYYREKSLSMLLGWLILSPIPCALTLDAPNSTRLFMLMPLFSIVTGYGAYVLFNNFRKRGFIVVKVILVLLFLLNVIFFLNLYFVHFNVERARFWHYGYKEAVMMTENNPNKKVVMRGEENFPYIYFLFYTRYNPVLFQRTVKYYPRTKDGFLYVRSFGKYQFVDNIDYKNTKKDTIYITDKVDGNGKNLIKLPNGDPSLEYLIK